MNSHTIIAGYARDYPIQAWLQGGNTPSAYGASDPLAAYVYQGRSATALFSPAVAWYTANSTQTGYGQGQVVVSYTGAQSAQLVPTGSYTLVVTRAPAANMSKVEDIVRMRLIVEAPPAF